MDAQAFENLVAEFEARSRDNAKGFDKYVLALALIGYAFFIGLLILLAYILLWAATATMGSFAKVKILLGLGIPSLILGYTLVRALLLKFDPPEGIAIARKNAPELFKLIDTIRAKLGGPPIHEVRVSDEFNACVSQVPRLGLLGWHRNYLVVGLPFMHGTSPAEFTAVLAHEYGHIAGAHSKIAGWIYTQRRAWQQLYERFGESESVIDWLVVKFLRWHGPRFAAASFVLSRQQEYEADAAAARFAGKDAAGAALIRSGITGRFLDYKFWPQLYDGQKLAPAPQFMPFARMPRDLRLGFGPEEAKKWLAEAMLRETDTADTHPCLRERLEALQVEPALPAPLTTTASLAFLGKQCSILAARFDRTWSLKAGPHWRENHEAHLERRTRLEVLRKEMAHRELSGEEALEYAQLIAQVESTEAALEHFLALAKRRRDDAPSQFHAGSALLELDRDDGLKYLDWAMDLDPDATPNACGLAISYLERMGRRADAKEYRARYENWAMERDSAET